MEYDNHKLADDLFRFDFDKIQAHLSQIEKTADQIFYLKYLLKEFTNFKEYYERFYGDDYEPKNVAVKTYYDLTKKYIKFLFPPKWR